MPPSFSFVSLVMPRRNVFSNGVWGRAVMSSFAKPSFVCSYASSASRGTSVVLTPKNEVSAVPVYSG